MKTQKAQFKHNKKKKLLDIYYTIPKAQFFARSLIFLLENRKFFCSNQKTNFKSFQFFFDNMFLQKSVWITLRKYFRSNSENFSLELQKTIPLRFLLKKKNIFPPKIFHRTRRTELWQSCKKKLSINVWKNSVKVRKLFFAQNYPRKNVFFLDMMNAFWSSDNSAEKPLLRVWSFSLSAGKNFYQYGKISKIMFLFKNVHWGT